MNIVLKRHLTAVVQIAAVSALMIFFVVPFVETLVVYPGLVFMVFFIAFMSLVNVLTQPHLI